MTCLYAALFGALILVIVAAAYTFIWWEILAHEKENLVAQINLILQNNPEKIADFYKILVALTK